MSDKHISVKKILERYNKALANRQLWSGEIDQAYKWMMPNRIPLSTSASAQFVTTTAETRGAPRNDHIFDSTGIGSILTFANNIQTSMMPPYSKWATIDVSDLMEDPPQSFIDLFGAITDSTIDSIKKQLENINNILFEEMHKSKLETVINESFQDLGIIMGVLLLRPGTLVDPINYIAVPANQVVIQEGKNGVVDNIFVPHTVEGRTLLETWPDAEENLTTELRNKISDSPENPITVIEGVITFQNEPEDRRYYYFLIEEGEKTALITRFLKIHPFIVFRGSKSPGEVYGRGPALIALPFVRELNIIRKLTLKGLQLNTIGIYAIHGDLDINPYTFSLDAGSIIYTQPGMNPDHAMTSFTGAPVQFAVEYIQKVQMEVKEIMFSNPLNVDSSGEKTATEASIINSQWIQKNAGFFSRLSYELLPPLIDKTILMLVEKGIIPKVHINKKLTTPVSTNPIFKLSFNSPLAKIQEQEEVQAIIQGSQFVVQTYGGIQGLLSMNIGELPEQVFERLNIPPALINYDFKNSPLIKKLQNSIQGGQADPTQPSLTGNVNQGPQAAQGPVQQA